MKNAAPLVGFVYKRLNCTKNMLRQLQADDRIR